MNRRAWLALAARLAGSALASAAASIAVAGQAGCTGDEPPRTPGPPPLPPLATDDLAALLPAAGVIWAARTRPRAIAQIPWLIPAIAAFAPEARLDRFAGTMGFDLRQAPEAWFVAFDLGAAGASDLVLVRHNARPEELERRFLERLSAEPLRAEDRPDVVRLAGRIGGDQHAFARLGRDVAAWQEKGDAARGPARIVAARAGGALEDLPSLAASDPMGALLTRFGEAPLVVLAPGPFDQADLLGAGGGEAARLLAVATGIGVALRPTAREGLGLTLAVAGDFGDGAAGASEVLHGAWRHLAASESGRILALDRTREPPLATHTPGALALAVELDPRATGEGLRALVEQDLAALLHHP